MVELSVRALKLQDNPLVYVATIAGRWLLKHSTPKWRIADLEEGFQRVVKEDRARKIAIGVLDQKRTFPNAIVLATDRKAVQEEDGKLVLEDASRFLVVDGQHRLWAQKFSTFEAEYVCVLHFGLSEVAMAKLFLEINDNQRRVPSSLRWDLVRLVRPEEDPAAILATEVIYELATDERSALFQRLDLTGEQPGIPLKQGSVAPEIRSLVASRDSPLKGLDFDAVKEILLRYFGAIKSLDPDAWNATESPFYKSRVVRALLRVLPDIVELEGRSVLLLSATDFRKHLLKIPKEALTPDEIREIQGSAGISAIESMLRGHITG